jgi:hypothetical protein
VGRGGGVLNNYIPVKLIEQNGLFGFTTSEWIQIISVSIAMIATVFSFITVVMQAKQFKRNNKAAEKRHWPIFRIQLMDRDSSGTFFCLNNIGFQFFNFAEARWVGDSGAKIVNLFNGEVKNVSGFNKNEKINFKYESLVVVIDFSDTENGSGHFEIDGYDFNGKLIRCASESIEIENNRVKNDIEFSHSFLKVMDINNK